MIQRIQTIWLALAALAAAGLFYFDVYHANVVKDGATIPERLTVGGHYPSLLLAVLAVLLPLVAIFLFKNRKKQGGIVLGSLLAGLGFLGVNMMRIGNYNKTHVLAESGSYWVGSVLPVVYIICLILALSGIKKDEKLVRSLDRLR